MRGPGHYHVGNNTVQYMYFPWAKGVRTGEISAVSQWISFAFGTRKEHILGMCLGGIFVDFLENRNFGELLQNA